MLGDRIGSRPRGPYDAASDAAFIEIVIKNEDPIDLLDFTASLTGVAREHEARIRSLRPGIDVDETRLLITEIRKGSIILELLPTLAPFVSSVEITNTAFEFVTHMKRVFSQLREPGGRAEEATTQQLKNMGDTVHAILKDNNGEMAIAARYQNGDILQEIVVTKQDARFINENVKAQRKELEDRSSTVLKKVLMRLHQSSVESLKVGKRTTEKGIVEHIDPTPRALVYVSDLAGQRIKDEILKPEGNPFQKGFVVDLDVETVAGKPRVYRILEVHDIIDLEDD